MAFEKNVFNLTSLYGANLDHNETQKLINISAYIHCHKRSSWQPKSFNSHHNDNHQEQASVRGGGGGGGEGGVQLHIHTGLHLLSFS